MVQSNKYRGNILAGHRTHKFCGVRGYDILREPQMASDDLQSSHRNKKGVAGEDCLGCESLGNHRERVHGALGPGGQLLMLDESGRVQGGRP